MQRYVSALSVSGEAGDGGGGGGGGSGGGAGRGGGQAVEKITPLAEKITEYILDHQNEAAQEDRWRTTMKREMVKSFREQRVENGKQRKAIDQQVNARRSTGDRRDAQYRQSPRQ